MLTGKMGAPETDRPGQVWEDAKAAGQRSAGGEGQHPGGPTLSHANFHSFIPHQLFSTFYLSVMVPGPAKTAGNKTDKTPCFRGVYILIQRQTNKIRKYLSCWMMLMASGKIMQRRSGRWIDTNRRVMTEKHHTYTHTVNSRWRKVTRDTQTHEGLRARKTLRGDKQLQ